MSNPPNEKVIREVAVRLAPQEGMRESDSHYLVRCPNRDCADTSLLLSKLTGTGRCLSEREGDQFREYTLQDLAAAVGLAAHGIHGPGTEPKSVTSSESGADTHTGSSRGSRTEDSHVTRAARALLDTPDLLDKFLVFAAQSGIAGEGNLLRLLCLIVTARLVPRRRLHVKLTGESATGKSEIANWVLNTLPDEVRLHFGGGVTPRAMQYFGSFAMKVVFVDEADVVPPELAAFLREAMTRNEVTRLVTEGDPGAGFTSREYRVDTRGLVLVLAGSQVIADTADASRLITLTPDASRQQTSLVLDRQAEDAVSLQPALIDELAVWQRAQSLLRECEVVIPFAPVLRRFFDADEPRRRRDFPRLLALVAAHACLHQYQRSTYPKDGRLVVVAEPVDYYEVYRFASSAFSQSAKRMTPAQEAAFTELLAAYGPNIPFALGEATERIHTKASTLRDKLQALETLGMVESEFLRGRRMWRIIGERSVGLRLPTPSELFPRTPETETPVAIKVSGRESVSEPGGDADEV